MFIGEEIGHKPVKFLRDNGWQKDPDIQTGIQA